MATCTHASGCTDTVSRRNLCSTHYREQLSLERGDDKLPAKRRTKKATPTDRARDRAALREELQETAKASGHVPVGIPVAPESDWDETESAKADMEELAEESNQETVDNGMEILRQAKDFAVRQDSREKQSLWEMADDTFATKAYASDLGDRIAAVGDRIDNLRPVIIKIGDKAEVVLDELTHEIFHEVAQVAATGYNQMLVGPPGSGKTHLASQIARALGRDFYMTGAVGNKYELTGFEGHDHTYKPSAFRKAFEHGGLFLWDEIDASSPNALVAFNAALENEWSDFPDGMVDKHEDFIAIASANTYGHGADRQYVGSRNKLDPATLDRFLVQDMDYDPKLEFELTVGAVAEEDKPMAREWVLFVQRVRAKARELRMQVIISQRASMKGAQLLSRTDLGRPKVEQMTIFKGIDQTQINMLRENE